MNRLAELYEDRQDAVDTYLNLLEKRATYAEEDIQLRLTNAIEDVKSRIAEIDDDIFDIERKEGFIGAQG